MEKSVKILLKFCWSRGAADRAAELHLHEVAEVHRLAEVYRALFPRREFSAGSTSNFASKYAFCSLFQDLQENHHLAYRFCSFLRFFCKMSASSFFRQCFEEVLHNFQYYFLQTFPKVLFLFARMSLRGIPFFKNDYLQYFADFCRMLQNFVRCEKCLSFMLY